MTEFYNGTDESSPFKRATQEMVSTEISSAMALTRKPGKSTGWKRHGIDKAL